MNKGSEKSMKKQIGAVVIGRNEGERLIACLRSILAEVECIVYVDSGSTDDSVRRAGELGVDVVSLALDIPFTAARARNDGASYLIDHYSGLEYIQFVDGDCQIQPGWIESAYFFLESNSQFAIACGRRRERHPEASPYNALCDIEWDTPVGECLACGGDALIRVKAFEQVGGYLDKLIAGEEPEMCFRLRALGWKIMRLNKEMTLHDAAMTSFRQWFRRTQRAGYAYAGGYFLHGKSAEKFRRKNVLSICFWALALPSVGIALGLLNTLFWFFLLIYPLQVMRLTVNDYHRSGGGLRSLLYASANVLGKFPQALGLLQFAVNKAGGRQTAIIEYK